MKKTVMTMVAVLMCGAAMAQPALMKGMESKRLDAEELMQARYVGVQNNLDAWIMEGRRHVKQVVLTDANLEPVSVAPIEGSGHMEVLAATTTAYRTGVLLADRGSKRTVVLRCEVDADSRALVERPDTVVSFTYGRKDVCMVWGASSPSGRYSAMVAVMQMNDEKQYSAYAALFDSRMQRLWQREYAMGSLHDVMVTDDGRVVTLGEEREGEETHFVFNVVDSTHASTFDAAVKCDPVQEVHLVNVLGSYAMVAGTYSLGNSKNASRVTAGVLTLSFHLDSAQLAGIMIRPLQNEDLNVMLNDKTKKMQKYQLLEHVVQLGSVPTPYGAVLALTRELEVEHTSDGGSTTREGYGVGVNLVAVDTTGLVRWVRNIRRNDIRGGGIPTLGLAGVGDKVCVIKSEHAKSPSIYDISDDARQMKQGEKGNVVMYSADADGNVEKMVLESKSKLTVLRALTRADGTLVYLGEIGKKTRLAELKGMN